MPLHELVARCEQVNLAISEADVNGIWCYGGPSPGATPTELASLKAALGRVLPPDYREFLAISNGWNGFYSDVDLFGCADFPFSPTVAFAWILVDVIDHASGGFTSYPWTSWLPIGISREDSDFFMLHLPSGAVSWVASGQEVERYDTFAEFFEAMISFNESNLDDVRADRWLGANRS